MVNIPRVNIFFNKDEFEKIEEKVKEKDYPPPYAYIKDLVLKEIGEP